jgi:hypothetical protein
MIYHMKPKTQVRFSISGILLALLTGCLQTENQAELVPFGHHEIDTIRRELLTISTNPENFDERKNALYIWSRFLMFSGANTTLEPAEHEGYYDIVQPRYPKPST